MDLKAVRKRLSSPTGPSDLDSSNDASCQVAVVRKLGLFNYCYGGTIKPLVILLMISPFLAFFVYIISRSPLSDRASSFAEARVLPSGFSSPIVSSQSQGLVNHSVKFIDVSRERADDGLIGSGFDKTSCFSRYESFVYRKASPYKPSPYLLSRLRKYEDLHKHCGPGTKPYNEALKQLKSGENAAPTECNYIVWISFSGLGNRILTLAAAYLYALLTDRVLLVDPGTDMTDLFCEPFPHTTWFLPMDFPLKKQFKDFDQKSPQCHGYMVKNNLLNSSSGSVPSYLYLHLIHNYGDHDKLFFCDQDQVVLAKVPWLILKTDNYFVPSLFLIPSFEQELSRLFPEKAPVFHHLGRYLLHPTNQVWGLVTRYYNGYLARADERVGLQIRVFDTGEGPFEHVKNQIISCVAKEKLLPEVDEQGPSSTSSPNQKSIAVLVTSLSSGYYDTLLDMYWEHPTVNGAAVGFFQPSHERFQQSKSKTHNRKAWAEMYLLSLTDKLVTSAWSTFGYVAQGLGGLKPWILYKAENMTTPDPPCGRVMSIEPCFHSPPFWDCKAKKGIDTGKLVPHVRHCEDISWGLKVVSGQSEL